MRKLQALICGALLALLLILYIVSFQVRFDQIAVVTTFDEAGPDAVRRNPGLYWKWPYPIQDVRLYDTRVQVLELPLEQHYLRDGQSVVAGAYVAWRVADPLALFRSLRTFGEAESQLRHRFADAKSLIGRYALDDLTNGDPARLKLAEAEQLIRDKLRAQMTAPQDYGIAIEAVGLTRIMLPEPVTPKVFDHMRKSRERLAQSARSEGAAAADAIRSTAERDRQTLLAFAERHAEAIRAEGARSAAAYVKEFEKNESFAVFLQQLDALKKILQRNTTFVLDTETAPFDLLGPPKPDAQDKKPGPATKTQ